MHLMGRMLEASESFGDVVWHGEVNGACFVVPIQLESTKKLTLTVHRDFIVLLQGVFEVFDMGETDSLDAKIVNNETESDGAPFMSPKPWRELTMVVSLRLRRF